MSAHVSNLWPSSLQSSCTIPNLQSDRTDFITFMLKANEINPNVSEENSNGSADHEENVNLNPEGEKILKGLTMEVREIIECSIYFGA